MAAVAHSPAKISPRLALADCLMAAVGSRSMKEAVATRLAF